MLLGHGDASEFSELPEHLRYRPYKVPNLSRGVSARYLNPRSDKPLVNKPTFQPDLLDNGKTWRAPPRYLEARARTPEPRRAPTYQETNEYQTHQRVARATGFGNAAARHLEHKHQEGPSAREKVSEHRDATRRIWQWRGVATNAPSLTFDEIRRRNRNLSGSYENARPKANRTPSVIEEYCRHGTPIKHHTMSEGYISQPRRRFDPRWVQPGGCGGGKWQPKANGPINRSTARSEMRVREFRSASKERTVGRRHVPRVATLSPAYSLTEYELHHESTTTSAATPASSDATPARAAGGTPADEPAHGVEVLEGPLTVSVPRGAVVRISGDQHGA